MSTLEFTVVEGILEKSTELFGKMENYVRVKVLGTNQEYRTKITEGSAKSKKSDNRIVWNETLRIPLPRNPAARLQVAIMDQDMGSDEVAGMGIINVDHCNMFSPAEQNFDVKLHVGTDKIAKEDPIKRIELINELRKKNKPVDAGELFIRTRYI